MNKPPPPPLGFDTDPDFDENPIWTEEDFARARPASEVLPPEVAVALVRRRGSQVAPTKQPVTLRLDPDVLAKFRATGPGWQSRMNEVLRNAAI